MSLNVTKYINLPFAEKGRSMEGVDCWGLVWLFYNTEFGIQVPSYAENYSGPNDRSTVSQAIKDNLPNWQKVDRPEIGDLLVFNILGLPLHTAIYIGGGDFLHAYINTNSCIERLTSITWKRRLAGIYRWAKT